MIRVKSFNDFIIEAYDNMSEMKDAAGLAITCEGKILLIHPTNSSWQKPTLGIPKGKIEIGESEWQAALREVKEEIGLEVPEEFINREPKTFVFFSGNKPKKTVTYYEVSVPKLESLGLTGPTLPKTMLQTEEVDWAGFIKYEEAYSKIVPAQKIILDRLKP